MPILKTLCGACSDKHSHTAEPSPPIIEWFSTVTANLVLLTLFIIMPQFKGFITGKLIISASIPFSDKISLADEEVFEHIITHSSIIKYNLKSYKYNLEKVTINSFIGNLSILLKGPNELQTICNLLVEYAQYCGIGAKTSMGMGGVKFE